MVLQLHDDVHVLVQNGTIGIKQDCSLAAPLVSTLSDMLMCVFYKEVLCYLSRHMGKPTMYLGENKGAEAAKLISAFYSDSTIPLLKSEISRF